MDQKGGSRRAKDAAMAAYMKAHGIERTTGVCALCYRVIKIDSIKSTYAHICRGTAPRG